MNSSLLPKDAVELFLSGTVDENLHIISKSGESIVKACGSYMSRKKVNGKWISKKQSYMILSCEASILYFALMCNGINTDNTYRSAPKH